MKNPRVVVAEFKHETNVLRSFQSRQKGDESLEMEEERRNSFVAIARTIETLTLSYADSYMGWLKEPSRFLLEMGLIYQVEGFTGISRS